MSRRPVIAQARVLRRVRAGELVRDAMAAEGYSPRTADRWRQRYPDFAAQMDQARHDAGAMDPRKHTFLAALYAGKSLDDAAVVAGVSRSAGNNWSREYPSFAAAYKRLAGQRVAARQATRAAAHETFFAGIEAGTQIRQAARDAGLHPRTPYAWKRTAPHLYARFRAIVDEHEEGQVAA